MSKNIVICCDGTGNQYCQKKTNVAKFYDILDSNPEQQLNYYDLGIGTLGSHLTHTKLGKTITRVLGLAIAYGITDNIEEAYLFLMKNYNPGDKIFLFGFSRGAYTVRAIGGMISKCGLLYAHHENLISYATKIYYNHTFPPPELKDFRDTFTQNALPHFIGVWDTVESVGFYDQVCFHDSILNKNVPFGYQALAVDERRSKFKPVLWVAAKENQTIVQKWFAGVHSDIGGSYADAGLSNITLNWMIKHAENCGLIINKKELQKKQDEFKPNILSKIHNSLTFWWRLLGWKRRNIKKYTQEFGVEIDIDDTVYDKIKQDSSYKPKNVPKQ